MNKIAPVLLVFGQSNAHASGVKLGEEEKIRVPLKHVKVLPRIPNQAFSPAPVVWEGYVSAGTNLGETQDDTACLPTAYARLWEDAAEEGEKTGRPLPDLYIIRISVGAQGVAEGYMWNPDYPRRLIPGERGTADIALYPLSLDVIRRAYCDLRARGLDPLTLGLHWLGTEEETGIPEEKFAGLADLHRKLIRGWREAAGCRVPVYLYLIRSTERSLSIGEDPANIARINAVFTELAAEDGDTETVDPRDCPLYDPAVPFTNGIYAEDGNHLGAQTHRWFAESALGRDLGLLRKLPSGEEEIGGKFLSDT
ncbi:MAG: hypothetical protein IIU08_10565 [Clostridia bacterium]|nr:hypothetical protein [Clostridia bacterium]